MVLFTVALLLLLLTLWLCWWLTANMLQSTSWALQVVQDKKVQMDTYYLGLYTAPSGALNVTNLDANFGGGGFTELTVAQATGYARIALTGGVATAVSGVGSLAYGLQTFNFTGGGTGATVLGWFVATGNIIGAGTIKQAQAEAAVVLPSVANVYNVGPFTITDQAIP